MSEHNPDAALNDDDTTAQLPAAFMRPDEAAVVAEQVENILDLDQMLSVAKRAERKSRICLRGDLFQKRTELLQELGSLVDEHGRPVAEDEDEALADVSRAAEIQRELQQVKREMDADSYVIRWRAMAPDEWDAFEEKHRAGPDRRVRNQQRYENELMAACAIAPTMTALEVQEKLRPRLVNGGQFVQVFNDAYFVNKTDGVDIPKSLPSWADPKPLAPERN